MNIVLIEAFFTGSHARWAREWKDHSIHDIKLLTLPGRFWKWRMHGAAITLAAQFNEQIEQADLILATDMLDLPLFMSLTRQRTHAMPFVLFMHENQLTYPWSEEDADPTLQRDQHYGFINYSSALAADAVCFNSRYHKDRFLKALEGFVRQYPDFQNKKTVGHIREKSSVLYPGIAWDEFDQNVKERENPSPVLLWNHRWEYDKRPEAFFNTLFALDAKGLDFQLIVLGEGGDRYPGIFDEAKDRLQSRILHFGYAENPEQYRTWLKMGDILPVTSAQDFFGLSVVEAMAAGLLPLLPDRLAYPEHIPPKWHKALLYESDVSFEHKLASWIENWPLPIRKYGLRQEMKKYDWKTLHAAYDRQMESLTGMDSV